MYVSVCKYVYLTSTQLYIKSQMLLSTITSKWRAIDIVKKVVIIRSKYIILLISQKDFHVNSMRYNVYSPATQSHFDDVFNNNTYWIL